MPRRTLFTFLAILLANFLVIRLLFPGPNEPVKVPYTLFKKEVEKRNVEKIYSRGESITGRFRFAVTYPSTRDSVSGAQPRPITPFATPLPRRRLASP